MQRDYVPRMIDLERSDYLIVKRMAAKRGLSEEVLLVALRKIIRELQGFQIKHPKLMSGEDYYCYPVDLGVIDQPYVKEISFHNRRSGFLPDKTFNFSSFPRSVRLQKTPSPSPISIAILSLVPRDW